METKEELFEIGINLLESFIRTSDRLMSSIMKKEIEGTEKYVGSEEKYHAFMKKMREYILDNNIDTAEDFDIHCRREPNTKSLRKALDILNTN